MYYGWASVDGGPVYKAVTSVGWNPQFMNEKKSVEVMLLKTFRQLSPRFGGVWKILLIIACVHADNLIRAIFTCARNFQPDAQVLITRVMDSLNQSIMSVAWVTNQSCKMTCPYGSL